MWLRRTKSRVHSAADSPKKNFACTSFKDIKTLFNDPQPPSPSSPDDNNNKTSNSICHRTRTRTRTVKSLTRSLSQLLVAEPLIRIPGADAKSVVIYFTSLRIVRRIFEDCKTVRSILGGRRFPIDERDLSMDSRFKAELRRILGELTELTLPRVFIGGRYVGGVDEVRWMHECGKLKGHVEGLPIAEPGTCEGCGGYGFVRGEECGGSHKLHYGKKGRFRSCASCNENGLLCTTLMMVLIMFFFERWCGGLT